jgi:hypothetical protein
MCYVRPVVNNLPPVEKMLSAHTQASRLNQIPPIVPMVKVGPLDGVVAVIMSMALYTAAEI